MMKTKFRKINSFFEEDKLIFIFISFSFFIIFSFAQKFYDDVNWMRIPGGTIDQCWQESINRYQTFASRIFVNFVIFLFTDNKNMIYWAAFMGLSIYILMYSLSVLFVDKNKKICNTIIACLVMLFPFELLNSAGWIATMNTYFSPVAFGFFSLIPLKKIYKNQNIPWWKQIIYSMALIYGANNEQMMIVILTCYIFSSVYFFYTKKITTFFILQLFLSIGSCLLIILCPGNYARLKLETINWFKNWEMFNFIDKLDLGYSTTMEWLLFGSPNFLIVICILLSFISYKKYSNNILFLSMIGIPTILLIVFGILKPEFIRMFPNMARLTDPLERNGLVTVVNRGGGVAFIKYFIYATFLILFLSTIIILTDNLKMLIGSIILLFSGFSSRVAIGFSPTIYASGYRTCTVMSFCIVAVACNIFSEAINADLIHEKSVLVINTVAKVLLSFSMINLLLVVTGK